MDISARTDYAVRALCLLATLAQNGEGRMSSEEMATGAGLPRKFLEAILSDLRRGGLVTSVRGASGGYRLARPAEEITVGAVFRAVSGPLAEVRGLRPQDVQYTGAAQHLPTVWVALRASLRSVLDEVSIAAVASGDLPEHVRALADAPDAWANR